MKLSKFIKAIVILTALALIYINMQMQIFDLAYKAKLKEKEIRKLLDFNSHVVYGILNLKSANHLGDKVLTQNSSLHFLDDKNIVEIKARPIRKPQVTIRKAEKKQNFLLSLFSLKSQAEAKPIE